MDCRNYIDFARERRNKIHPKGKLPSTDEHIEEYKIQVISLFILSLVCLLKNIKHENKPQTGKRGTQFSKKKAKAKLTQWLERNKKRFHATDFNFLEYYIETTRENSIDEILTVVMKDPILKNNLQFLLQKIGKNNNVEMITETDLGKTVPFENFFTIFLFHTVNSLLECKVQWKRLLLGKNLPHFRKII